MTALSWMQVIEVPSNLPITGHQKLGWVWRLGVVGEGKRNSIKAFL